MISEQIEAQILAKDNPDIWCEYSSLRTHRGGQRCWVVVVVVEVGVLYNTQTRLRPQLGRTQHYSTMYYRLYYPNTLTIGIRKVLTRSLKLNISGKIIPPLALSDKVW